MSITNPSRDKHGQYPESPVIGEYRTDNERTPRFNPEASGVMFLAGEPILLTLAGARYAFMHQGTIRPGETGYALRKFSADFPCILSADVLEGTAIYWDIDAIAAGFPVGAAKLFGDLTNGYLLGYATHHYMKNPLPEISGDKVICGTTASTTIYLTSIPIASTVKGTVPVA